MAIRRQYGDITDIASLGRASGEMQGAAQAAQERNRYERQLELMARQQAAEEELALFRHDLNVQSQKRAMAWEMEKMEARSRLDFEREESERQAKLNRIQAGFQQIEESDWLTEQDKQKFKLMHSMNVYGRSIPAETIFPELRRTSSSGSSMLDQIRKYQLITKDYTPAQETFISRWAPGYKKVRPAMMGKRKLSPEEVNVYEQLTQMGPLGGAGIAQVPEAVSPDETATSEVRVEKDGQQFMLPAVQLQAAIKQGYKRVD